MIIVLELLPESRISKIKFVAKRIYILADQIVDPPPENFKTANLDICTYAYLILPINVVFSTLLMRKIKNAACAYLCFGVGGRV